MSTNQETRPGVARTQESGFLVIPRREASYCGGVRSLRLNRDGDLPIIRVTQNRGLIKRGQHQRIDA